MEISQYEEVKVGDLVAKKNHPRVSYKVMKVHDQTVDLEEECIIRGTTHVFSAGRSKKIDLVFWNEELAKRYEILEARDQELYEEKQRLFNMFVKCS